MRWISLLLFQFLLVMALPAQQHRKYILSHENMQRLEQLEPKVSKTRAGIETFVAQNQRKATIRGAKTVGLAFHILYNEHHPATKISQAQVFAQVDALNAHFNTLISQVDGVYQDNLDQKEKNTELDLTFCLPQAADRTAFIHYQATSRKAWELNDEMKNDKSGGRSPIAPEQYLNIWVVDLADHLTGFAQMPGGPVATDGIVIDYTFFGVGTQGKQQGKTLIHLIGNYLGLYSLWGESACADDYVFDTPIHNSPNFACATGMHLSSCGDFPREMLRNFMDSTPDDCATGFTLGQKLRLHTILSAGGPRHQLTQTAVDCSPEETLEEIVVDESALLPNETILVYPNPALHKFQVQFTEDIGANITIKVSQLDGKVLHQQASVDSTAGAVSIDIATWQPGIYLVIIEQGHERRKVEKLVVNP